MNWLDSLDRELHAASMPARRRRRIVAELADHLACDPAAEERLGGAAELARQFADELGTVFARRAAFATFLALVPLGALFVALFTLAAVYTTNVDSGVTIAFVLGTQLAFVGGMLALLRAWRLRRQVVIPAGEARILLRRAALGLAGAALTVVALAAVASGFYPGVQWSLPSLAWTTVGVGAVAVATGTVILARAARFGPLADGEVGDLQLDLGPLVPEVLRGGTWRLALLIAAALAATVALAGAVAGDPLDGLARAFGEGLLCIAGFAALGRPLGLRR